MIIHKLKIELAADDIRNIICKALDAEGYTAGRVDFILVEAGNQMDPFKEFGHALIEAEQKPPAPPQAKPRDLHAEFLARMNDENVEQALVRLRNASLTGGRPRVEADDLSTVLIAIDESMGK